MPRVTPDLMKALVRHRYDTHTRELDTLLLRASIESRGKYLERTEGVTALLEASTSTPAFAPPGPAPDQGFSRRSNGASPSCASIDSTSRSAAVMRSTGRAGKPLICTCGSSRVERWRWADGTSVRLRRSSPDRTRTRGAGSVVASSPSCSIFRRRLADEGGEALRRSLGSEWRASAAAALLLIEALEADRVRGGWRGEK